MIAFLYRIIIGSFHAHEWETVKIVRLTEGDDTIGSRIFLRCKTCGDYKKRDLK
jgi:hypothetical protein